MIENLEIQVAKAECKLTIRTLKILIEKMEKSGRTQDKMYGLIVRQKNGMEDSYQTLLKMEHLLKRTDKINQDLELKVSVMGAKIAQLERKE